MKFRLPYEQGEIFEAILSKKISLPDSEEYYVFFDNQNVRRLLPVKYYQHYNLQFGKNFLCRFDKLNCAGQLFFEPLHPYYKCGKTYDFVFIGEKKIWIKKLKTSKNLGFVIDKDHKEHFLPSTFKSVNLVIGQVIQCKIIHIKKGRFQLKPIQQKD